MQKKRRGRILRRVLWAVAIVLVLAVGGTLAYTQIGVMAAEPDPLASVRENPAITVTDAEQGIVLAPADGESDLGLVFIPGAKVDPWAYAAILQGLAEDGTTVVITRPWLNLAFFDPRGLDAFTSAAPDIDVWGVGGHSLGGVRACLELAERIGLPVVVSSALESSVGLAAGLALVAALPELPYACGLATVQLFQDDLVTDPFRPVDGALEVRRPDPDPDLLASARASDELTARWVARLAAVEARA